MPSAVRKFDLGSVLKFDPNHAADGEFASAPGAVSLADVKSSLTATETTDGRHALDVRDKDGKHIGLVYNAALEGKPPQWVGYHVSGDVMQKGVDDSKNPYALGTSMGQRPVRPEVQYRGSKEEAIADLAMIEQHLINRDKQYAADDAAYASKHKDDKK